MYRIILALSLLLPPAASAQTSVEGSSTARPLDLTYAEPKLSLSVLFIDEDGSRMLDEQERGVLKITLTNNGRGKAYDVKLKAEGELPSGASIDRREESLGVVKPGERREASFTVTAGDIVRDGQFEMVFRVEEKFDKIPAPLEVGVKTRAPIPPDLILADFEIDDDRQGVSYGNGDGKPAQGETVELTFLVQNVGRGDAVDVKAEVVMGRELVPAASIKFNLGDMKSGEHQTFTTAFAIPEGYNKLGSLPLELKLTEAKGRYGRSESPAIELNAASGTGGGELQPQRVEIAGRGSSSSGTPPVQIATISVDVDGDIPRAALPNSNAVAVIIGNAAYSRSHRDVPDVEFALRDAAVMKEYVVRAFGFREGNVLHYADAGLTVFRDVFGTESEPRGKLYNMVKAGKSDVFVYYSGHGAPDVAERKGYFVPVDCAPNSVARNGYSLDLFYENLGKVPARSTTVVIDACFSGGSERGMLIDYASPVGLRITNPVVNWQGGGLFTSSAENQISSWYPEKKHGLFTYFFLKGLQGAADENQDDRLTAGELGGYLSDVTEGVPYWARRLHGREQTPQFTGDENQVLVRW